MSKKICVSDRLKDKIQKDFDIKPISRLGNKHCFDQNKIKEKISLVDKDSIKHFTYGMVFGLIFGLILILLGAKSNYWLYSILGVFIALIGNLMFHGFKYREINIKVSLHKNAYMDLFLNSTGFFLSLLVIFIIG